MRYAAKAQSGARPGRPRKFNRPSQAVTLTLPNNVVGALQAIDADLSQAVVGVVEPLMPIVPRPSAELTSFGGSAVISVPRNRKLKERTGVELVPLSDGRALISFDERLSIQEIELRLRDALNDPDVVADDRILFEALANILSDARRVEGVTVQRRSIIVLHGIRTEPGSGRRPDGLTSDPDLGRHAASPRRLLDVSGRDYLEQVVVPDALHQPARGVPPRLLEHRLRPVG